MKKNLFLMIIVAVLIFSPLILARNAEFAGADDRAEKAISTVAPNYKPWMSNIWEPPSGEVETFLFALQAALGSFVIGYIIGLGKGKKLSEETMVKEHVQN